ncbi:hypothetical protein Vqi01_32800 [Micromonospora qiuiae]|uniref:Gas vesicle protein G n=1 Tax=Micromonospora qiuiae TaxID=502268 RepID=A0ABQ4JD96_9ACTN|nr:gas vesicle protein GvpG [Micromonospora qiuiae]GIJ28118.1 hypothetical protein Vqi01_32800 [Micromonospora qiuiae]
MDILWALLTLPYAPVRGLTAVVKVIAREAESQQYSPVGVRRELEELDAAEAAGEITAEERDRRQQEVLDRLTTHSADAGAGGSVVGGAGGSALGGAGGSVVGGAGRAAGTRATGRRRATGSRSADCGTPRNRSEGGERDGDSQRRRPGRQP